MPENCEKTGVGEVYAFVVSLPPFPVYVRGAGAKAAAERLARNFGEVIHVGIENAMETGELDEAAVFPVSFDHQPICDEPVF